MQIFLYALQEELEKASDNPLVQKYYLAGSDMSIRGLADFCGYESELHFMRQFKKFVGMTPTEYRRSSSVAANCKHAWE